MQLDITPTRDVYNPLLKRREISFFTNHELATTPKLYDVRKQLATKYGANEELVFVRNLKTLTGTTKAIGKAEIYDTVAEANSLVPKHIQIRNLSERHKTKESTQKVVVTPKKETVTKKE